MKNLEYQWNRFENYYNSEGDFDRRKCKSVYIRFDGDPLEPDEAIDVNLDSMSEKIRDLFYEKLGVRGAVVSFLKSEVDRMRVVIGVCAEEFDRVDEAEKPPMFETADITKYMVDFFRRDRGEDRL